MARLGNTLRRAAALFRRDRLDDELREEMAAHIELRRQALVDEGMDPREAAWTARRMFGNPAVIREETRDMWGFPSLESVWQDVRYGGRMLARSRTFTVTAVLSLAIGIGASAAVFSLADALLFRALPVRDPGELAVMRWSSGPTFPFEMLSGNASQAADGLSSTSFSLDAFRRMRDAAAGRAAVFGYADLDRLTIAVDGDARIGAGHVVSGNYFSVLGVSPVLGRALLESDDQGASPPVALVAHHMWEQRMRGAADVIGRTITVNGLPFSVVGVLPRAFHGTGQAGDMPDVFIPMASYEAVARQPGPANPNFWWVVPMARVAADVPREAIRSTLDVVLKQTVAAARPAMTPAELPHLAILPGARGQLETREALLEPIQLMAAAVAVVLLVACANVANLLLARGRARVRELTVRVAIGAPRRRVVRQLLTEALMLAGLGSLLGLVAAHWIAGALMPALQVTTATLAPPALDARALLFVAALATLCTVLAGLLPAWRASDVALARGLHEAGRSAAGRRGRGLSSGLVIVQIALSMTLVATAGLLVRSVRELGHVDLGFDASQLLIFRLDASSNGYEPERVTRTYASLLAELRAAPGVDGVTMSSHTLMANSSAIGIASGAAEPMPDPGSAEAGAFRDTHLAWHLGVDAAFFDVMRIPLLQGDGFKPEDADGSRRGVVVNAALARQLFGADDAVGRAVRLGMNRSAPPYEIVGVVADSRYTSVRADKPPTVFVPQRAGLTSAVTFMVRTSGPPEAFSATARDIVRRVDAALPLMGLRSMTQQVAESVRREALFARLATGLGIVTLLLAAIGLYALQAYAVGQRTAEIGIRMALGATRGAVRWMVLRQSLVIAAAGLALGSVAALASTPVVDALLFNVRARDPWILAAAAALLLAASLAAAYAPSRRASRVDPLSALRAE